MEGILWLFLKALKLDSGMAVASPKMIRYHLDFTGSVV